MYKTGERVTVVGKTGSGKTTKILELINDSPVSPVLILDTKIDKAFPKAFPDAKIMEGLGIPGKKDEMTIIRPLPEEAIDPMALDDWLQAIGRSNNILVVIDEMYQVHRHGQAGPGLVGLLTRGRSRGITMLLASQRPAWVSKFVFTECEHFYFMRLLNPDDRKIMSQYMGFPEIQELVLPKFEGVYSDGETLERFHVEPFVNQKIGEEISRQIAWI